MREREREREIKNKTGAPPICGNCPLNSFLYFKPLVEYSISSIGFLDKTFIIVKIYHKYHKNLDFSRLHLFLFSRCFCIY